MRALETLLAVLLFLTILLPRFRFQLPKAWFVPWILLLTLTAHLLLERYRWQMIPLYLTTLLIAGLILYRTLHAKHASDPILLPFSSKMGFVLGCLILLLAIIPPVLLPIYRIPKPTGPHQVGRTQLHFVDSSRPETFTQDPRDVRELMVTAWYPANPAPGSQPAPYWEYADIVGGYLIGENGQPPVLAEYMTLVKANAYQDAPLVPNTATYPVLIFSPGYMTNVLINTVQMETLASHGYVVFGIDHPYENFGTVYPDGRTALADPTLRTLVIQGDTGLIDFEESQEIWTADTTFVLDQLDQLNAAGSGSIWAGQLDLAHLGVFGTSFGGSTAGAFCYVDPRCAAGVNIDGRQHGHYMQNAVLKQPFMFIYSALNQGTNDFLFRKVENDSYKLVIAGSTHMGFSDLGFASPILRYSDILGSINPKRMAEITNAYLVAFFDQYIQGISTSLLEGPSSSYPEINSRSRSFSAGS